MISPECCRLAAARVRRAGAAEDGQTLLLGVGLVAVVAALILALASASAVYLDLKTLTSLADSAAAAAADAIDDAPTSPESPPRPAPARCRPQACGPRPPPTWPDSRSN
ncbi:hypothetical protein [Actinomyces ruminis]|uniref:hypothetical protein n=1 Tax=Actinomyces ruminis TaxID=1937003 RepID=UPI0030B831FE